MCFLKVNTISLKGWIGLGSKENDGFPHLKSEQFAVSLRKSKKKELIGLKRLRNTPI